MIRSLLVNMNMYIKLHFVYTINIKAVTDKKQMSNMILLEK